MVYFCVTWPNDGFSNVASGPRILFHDLSVKSNCTRWADYLSFFFFFLTLMPKTPFEKKFSKWPTFIFREFFFCRFPHFRRFKWREWAPAWHVSVRHRLKWCDVFFLIFFSFPPFQLAGLTFLFYFFDFFCFFGNNIYIIKIQ